MRKFSKFLTVVIVLSMTASLVACRNGNAESSTEQNTSKNANKDTQAGDETQAEGATQAEGTTQAEGATQAEGTTQADDKEQWMQGQMLRVKTLFY